MTFETAIESANLVAPSPPKDRKRNISGPDAAPCEIVKDTVKDAIPEKPVSPPVAQVPAKAEPKQSQPSLAPNNGWGMFQDRQTFVDMHFC